MAKCIVCGTDYGFFERTGGRCADCKARDLTREQWEAETVAQDAEDQARFRETFRDELERRDAARVALERQASMLLTTEDAPRGIEIEARLGIVTAECAFGLNIFKDIATVGRDIFGGRSLSLQKTLKDARNAALDDLRAEAAALGADAVIAIDLDYSEFSGGGKSMLFLVVSGTAVKLANSAPIGPSSGAEGS